MYEIAICEDEEEELEEIVYMVREILQKNQIDYNVSCYRNGEGLLYAIQNGMNFHLLLLDVLLKGIDGIALAKQLRKLQNMVAIVFMSWNKEMALEGYKVNATRYLAKPIQEEYLQEALLFCYENQIKKEILLPTQNGQYKISLSDIVYAEAQGRGVKIILLNGQLEVKLKISELETMLPDQRFILCHRSYIVNLAFVQYIHYYEIKLQDGQTIPISKYRFLEVKKKLVTYLAE